MKQLTGFAASAFVMESALAGTGSQTAVTNGADKNGKILVGIAGAVEAR